MAEYTSLSIIADGLLISAAAAAGFYCFILARRLKALKNTDTGVGAAIAAMSTQVDEIRVALDQAKATSRASTDRLAELTTTATTTADRLEGLVNAGGGAGAGPRGDDDDELEDMSAAPVSPLVAEQLEELSASANAAADRLQALEEAVANGGASGDASGGATGEDQEARDRLGQLENVVERLAEEKAGGAGSGEVAAEETLNRLTETCETAQALEARLKELMAPAGGAEDGGEPGMMSRLVELVSAAEEAGARLSERIATAPDASASPELEEADDITIRLVELIKAAETAAENLASLIDEHGGVSSAPAAAAMASAPAAAIDDLMEPDPFLVKAAASG